MAEVIDIREALAGKWEDGTRPADLFARYVQPDPAAYLQPVIAGLDDGRKKVRSGCSELASLLSEAEPELVYPHVRTFCERLATREPVARWEAACTLGHLAAVDGDQVIPPQIDRLVGYLTDESIVLQGHCVRALARIAAAHPDRAPAILDALLAAEAAFPGSRLGQLIEPLALPGAFDRAPLSARVRAFAERHAASEVKSVASKARRVLRTV